MFAFVNFVMYRQYCNPSFIAVNWFQDLPRKVKFREVEYSGRTQSQTVTYLKELEFRPYTRYLGLYV